MISISHNSVGFPLVSFCCSGIFFVFVAEASQKRFRKSACRKIKEGSSWYILLIKKYWHKYYPAKIHCMVNIFAVFLFLYISETRLCNFRQKIYWCTRVDLFCGKFFSFLFHWNVKKLVEKWKTNQGEMCSLASNFHISFSFQRCFEMFLMEKFLILNIAFRFCLDYAAAWYVWCFELRK